MIVLWAPETIKRVVSRAWSRGPSTGGAVRGTSLGILGPASCCHFPLLSVLCTQPGHACPAHACVAPAREAARATQPGLAALTSASGTMLRPCSCVLGGWVTVTERLPTVEWTKLGQVLAAAHPPDLPMRGACLCTCQPARAYHNSCCTPGTTICTPAQEVAHGSPKGDPL